MLIQDVGGFLHDAVRFLSDVLNSMRRSKDACTSMQSSASLTLALMCRPMVKSTGTPFCMSVSGKLKKY